MRSSRLTGFLLSGLQVSIEFCWLYPWAWLFGALALPSVGLPLVSPLMLAALLIVARFGGSTLLRRSWPDMVARLVLVAIGLGIILVTTRYQYFPEYEPNSFAWVNALQSSTPSRSPSALLWTVLFGLFVWWRGLRLARSETTYESQESDFRLGLIGLVTSLILIPATAADLPGFLEAGGGLVVIGFMVFSLVSLSLVRLIEMETQSAIVGAQAPDLRRRWFSSMILVVSSLTALGVGLAALFSFDLIDAIFLPLWNVFGAVLYIVFIIIALPLGLLAEAVIYLARLILHPGRNPLPAQDSDFSLIDQLKNQGAGGILPPWFNDALRWVAIVVLIAVALYLVARTIRAKRGSERQPDDVEEERASVWSGLTVWQVLLTWGRSIWRLLFPIKAVEVPATGEEDQESSSPSEETRTVRQIYRQLLRFGAQRGTPRPAYATPHEYLPVLQEGLSPAADLAAITDIYVKVRYADEPPSPAETDDAKKRWERVRSDTLKVPPVTER